jgi:hypothetical protein
MCVCFNIELFASNLVSITTYIFRYIESTACTGCVSNNAVLGLV